MTSSNGNIFCIAGHLCRSLVNSPHEGQWRRALIFSLICALINGCVNNREAGDLRRHQAHYDITVTLFLANSSRWHWHNSTVSCWQIMKTSQQAMATKTPSNKISHPGYFLTTRPLFLTNSSRCGWLHSNVSQSSVTQCWLEVPLFSIWLIVWLTELPWFLFFVWLIYCLTQRWGKCMKNRGKIYFGTVLH